MADENERLDIGQNSAASDENDDVSGHPAGRRYEAPRITWREPYEPLTFGLSCAKQPGNPGCNPGPFSS